MGHFSGAISIGALLGPSRESIRDYRRFAQRCGLILPKRSGGSRPGIGQRPSASGSPSTALSIPGGLAPRRADCRNARLVIRIFIISQCLRHTTRAMRNAARRKPPEICEHVHIQLSAIEAVHNLCGELWRIAI